MEIPWVASMFAGIRPAVVALIAVPTFNMAKQVGINLANCWIPIISALLIWAFGVNPIIILLEIIQDESFVDVSCSPFLLQ